MIAVRGLLLAAALVWFAAPSATAHHAAEVAAQIRARDMFFEPVDRAAPGFELETADGRKVSLGDFRGKVVVLDFIYARCKDFCPLQSDLLARVQQQINRTPMRDLVEFVSVATDTEDAKETAQVIRGYGAKHGFDPANWTFLYRGSGSLDAGIKAAAAYGPKFEVDGDDQMHGVVTHVIDQASRMRGRFHGLKFDLTDLILFVNALTNEPPDTAIERVEAVPAPARGGFAAGFRGSTCRWRQAASG
jgi:protein SCO1